MKTIGKRKIFTATFLILFIGLLCFTPHVFAVSYVYVQNNTSLEFSVNSVQTGDHTLDNDEWWRNTGTIVPWQKKTLALWTNRDEGIHNGDNFYFTTSLSSGSEQINLQLKLRGKWVHSSMWHSLSGNGFDHAWQNDRNWHEETFTIGGKSITVKYYSYYTGHDDDLLYIIQENEPYTQNIEDRNSIHILSYNIFMLSGILGKDQDIRAQAIPDHVRGYDVIVFNEAFDNDARENILLPALQDEYPYRTNVLDKSGAIEDGGVVIVSKWPIEDTQTSIYNDCISEDCLSAKGVLYVRINKMGKIYNIFGTHTQAWNSDEEQVRTRLNQLQQLRDFIDELDIPETEPVIVAGDLNVDSYANAFDEYNRMFEILDAQIPSYNGHPYTFDPDFNLYASGNVKEYLDYVLNINGWLQPSVSLNEVRILRSITDAMEGWDLSDHFAVYGHFTYPDTLMNNAPVECDEHGCEI